MGWSAIEEEEEDVGWIWGSYGGDCEDVWLLGRDVM
jgi:hypothetical protein